MSQRIDWTDCDGDSAALLDWAAWRRGVGGEVGREALLLVPAERPEEEEAVVLIDRAQAEIICDWLIDFFSFPPMRGL